MIITFLTKLWYHCRASALEEMIRYCFLVRYPSWTAIAISSVAFGLFHLWRFRKDWRIVVIATVGGPVFGAAFMWLRPYYIWFLPVNLLVMVLFHGGARYFGEWYKKKFGW